MTPREAPATVEVEVASMVCTSGVPALVGDYEYIIPTGGRGRRGVKVGDHLPVNHELVVALPDRFAPSGEPPDCWPIGVELEEVRRERERQRVRVDPCNVRKVTPVCMRCGQESEHSVILLDPPQATDLLSALSELDDYDYRGRLQLEQKFGIMAQAAKDQADELALAEQQWRTQHLSCPDGTPPLPEVPLPEQAPLFQRLPSFRTLG